MGAMTARTKAVFARFESGDSQTVSGDGVFCALILLTVGGRAVPKAYSSDLRVRVIEAVAAGASRREAAERFEVSIASAVKWLQRWRDDNSAAPKPSGGSVSPLEEFAAEILAVVAEHPDLTLEETVAELRKQRIRASRSALWRFLDRHNITLKKNPASCRTAASRCGARTPALDTRARFS
jgi:transposase